MGEKGFTEVLQKLLPTNPAHADLFNKLFDTLLQNDLFLKDVAEALEKETHYSKKLDQVDLFVIKENGVYYITHAENSPNGEEGYLEVHNHTTEFKNCRVIFWHPYNLNVGGYFNVLTDGRWLGWQQLVTVDDLESKVDKLDTIYNRNRIQDEDLIGSAFVNKSWCGVGLNLEHAPTSDWLNYFCLDAAATGSDINHVFAMEINGSNPHCYFTNDTKGKKWKRFLFVEDAKEIISNPNWIINSYFKNPINQRGIKTGTQIKSGTYGLDHWRAYAYNGNYIVYLKDEHVEIDCMNDYGAMEQVIENSEYLSGKTVTLSIEVVNVNTGHGYIQLLNNVFERHLELPKKNGIYSLTVALPNVLTKEDPLRVIVGCNLDLLSATDSIVGLGFKWIKLELGDIATMYVPPNPTIELLECQRFLQKIGGWWKWMAVGFVSKENKVAYFPLTLQSKMRAVPTLTIKNKEQIKVVGGNINTNIVDLEGFQHASENYYNISFQLPEKTVVEKERDIVVLYFGENVELIFDAELK